MDKTETKKILSVFKATYPFYYKDADQDTLQAAVNIWNTVLADYDYQTVSNAAMAFIATDTKGFPPAPGLIVDQITKMREGIRMTEVDAWRYVRKALKNARYGYREEFEKLPEIVRRCVGSAEQLKDWVEVPVDELDTVVASNFQRSFRGRVENEREYMALPSKVKEFIQVASENQKMLKE